VRRLDDATPLPVGGNATVDIEIIELSLRSVDQITVTGTNPPEPWDVEVDLSPNPQPTGSMTIKHHNTNGGTYDSTLPVCPLFTFSQQVPPFDIQQLDICLAAFPPVMIGTSDAPWTHGVQTPLVCPASQLNFRADGPHTGPHPGAQPIEEAIIPVPAMGPIGLGVFTLALLLVAVLFVLSRRRGSRAA
jgi:hypothetical protein